MSGHGRPGEVKSHGASGYPPPPAAAGPVAGFVLVASLSVDLGYGPPLGTMEVSANDFVESPGGYSGFEVKRATEPDTEYAASIVFDCADAPPNTIVLDVRATVPGLDYGQTSVELTDTIGFCGVG